MAFRVKSSEGPATWDDQSLDLVMGEWDQLLQRTGEICGLVRVVIAQLVLSNMAILIDISYFY